MGKSSSSPPAAPDPVATAQAQTQSNKQTAKYQQGLNMINQVTPYGTLTYTKTGTIAGAPQFTATTSLTPEGQKAFDLAQQVTTALNNLALTGTSQVASALSTPFTLPGPVPTLNQDDLQAAQDAIYNANTEYLDPQFARKQTQLATQLANSGIAQGSAAYNSAMEQLGETENQAYQGARDAAISGAQTYASNLLNSQLASYQTGVQDTAYAQELPINEVTALEGAGQVAMPSFASTPQSSVATTNTAQIAQNAYNDQLAAWEQQQQQQNAMLGGIFGGLSSLGSAWIMSDRRVKTAISKIGKTDSGVPLYAFRYKSGGPVQIGAMAQDLEKRDDARHTVHEIDGVKHVDYGALAQAVRAAVHRRAA